jgi:GR25 family glycosyltransferase involved in LPS biosynthesis
MEQQLSRTVLDHTYIDAIDAQTTITKPHTIRRGHVRRGERLLPGEVCCTLSHIKAVEHAVSENWNEVLILEDDVTLTADFDSRLKIANRLSPGTDLLYLSGSISSYVVPPFIRPSVVPVNFYMGGTFSYIIRRKAYQKVLEVTRRLDTTYDDALSHAIADGELSAGLAFPFLVKTSIWDSEVRSKPSDKRELTHISHVHFWK